MAYAADRAVARAEGKDPESIPIPPELGPPPGGMRAGAEDPAVVTRIAADAVAAERRRIADLKAKRPTVKYSAALGGRICALLEEGLSVSKICEAPGMPHKSSVIRWAHDEAHPFAQQYAHARARGYRLHADEIVDIADEVVSDAVQVSRNKLRIDARKWVLSKLFPKEYGDKIEVAADPEAPFTVIETIIVQPPKQSEP